MFQEFIEILILSAIQGISEFLPVSSAAHLVLVSKYYNFINQNLLIDICLHLGSLIAIIIYFRSELLNFIKNKKFLIKIIFASIPLIPAGYFIYITGLINLIRNLEVIGWMTLIFGIILYFSDKKKVTKEIEKDFNFKSAVIFGLFQTLALIPGVSRAGITITSGRILGFDRFESAKISFLLSIPTLAAVSIFGFKNIAFSSNFDFSIINLVAVLLSFITSYLTIKYFLIYIQKFSLKYLLSTG